MTTPDCSVPFEGDADLYGLGVRLGFYAQLFSIQLSMVFPLPGDTGSITGAFWYYLGLLITLTYKAKISTSSAPLHPLDAHIILFLCSSLTRVGFQTWRLIIPDVSIFTRWCKVFIDLWRIILNCWFLWRGMDLFFEHVSSPECPPGKTTKMAFFFFGKVALDGWYRNLNRATNTLAILHFCYTYFYTGHRSQAEIGDQINNDSQSLRSFFNTLFDNTYFSSLVTKGQYYTSVVQEEEKLPPWVRKLTYVYYWGVPVWGFVSKVYVIVAVEMMIWWNGVEGVNGLEGSGQVVPLILGLGGLLQQLKNVGLYFPQRVYVNPGDNVVDHYRGLVGLKPVRGGTDFGSRAVREEAVGGVETISVDSGSEFNEMVAADGHSGLSTGVKVQV